VLTSNRVTKFSYINTDSDTVFLVARSCAQAWSADIFLPLSFSPLKDTTPAQRAGVQPGYLSPYPPAQQQQSPRPRTFYLLLYALKTPLKLAIAHQASRQGLVVKRSAILRNLRLKAS
jgi:hypothetical protein